MVKRKGVSPLIAVLMLIGITLIISGILAGWATNFATSQRKSFEQCIDARVLIRGASYNSTTDRANLIVYNYGSVPLTLATIVEYQNLTVYKVPNSTEVAGGDIKNVYIDGLSDEISEITIQSEECAGASDTIKRKDIQGL